MKYGLEVLGEYLNDVFREVFINLNVMGNLQMRNGAVSSEG